MTTERETTQKAENAFAAAVVLVLNHRGDPFGDMVRGLQKAGFEVEESTSLRETQRLLDRPGGRCGAAPSAVVLNPLVVHEDGVEVDLLKGIQKDGPPVPVILLVDDVVELQDSWRRLSVPFRDFIVKPHSTEELVHRVELAIRERDRFVTLHRENRDLADQITTDFKTQLLSERHFRNVLQREFKLAQRKQQALSLLLVDVDNFKAINDSTEYAFGDTVLKEVARALRETVRETDFAARFGGDEFALLLPQTTPTEAVHTASRVRKAIAMTVVESGDYSQQVTVSIGIDTFDGRSTTTPDELRSHANQALKEAKQRGKDQVWLYSQRGDSGNAATS